ncbi:MAG: lactate utilization protein [Lachnospirales bacterium]
MTPVNEYNKLLAEKTIEGLEKRNMQGFYAENKEEAVKIALSLIPEGSVVSWGGSATLQETGLINTLKNNNYQCLDRNDAESREEKEEIAHKALNADYYLMSTNAMTIDGQLINIDGNGNRVAALIYGPKNVIIVTGINKICDTYDSALSRARNKASIPNVIRFDCNTPCKKTGKCMDCLSPETVCCQFVHTRFSRIKDRIKVIIVGENLGF